MDMEKRIEELYEEAKRFDESDLYRSAEYDAISEKRCELYENICALFGPAIVPLLEEYADAIGDETELECRHFFKEGYLMGQKP